MKGRCRSPGFRRSAASNRRAERPATEFRVAWFLASAWSSPQRHGQMLASDRPSSPRRLKRARSAPAAPSATSFAQPLFPPRASLSGLVVSDVVGEAMSIVPEDGDPLRILSRPGPFREALASAAALFSDSVPRRRGPGAVRPASEAEASVRAHVAGQAQFAKRALNDAMERGDACEAFRQWALLIRADMTVAFRLSARCGTPMDRGEFEAWFPVVPPCAAGAAVHAAAVCEFEEEAARAVGALRKSLSEAGVRSPKGAADDVRAAARAFAKAHVETWATDNAGARFSEAGIAGKMGRGSGDGEGREAACFEKAFGFAFNRCPEATSKREKQAARLASAFADLEESARRCFRVKGCGRHSEQEARGWMRRLGERVLSRTQQRVRRAVRTARMRRREAEAARERKEQAAGLGDGGGDEKQGG